MASWWGFHLRAGWRGEGSPAGPQSTCPEAGVGGADSWLWAGASQPPPRRSHIPGKEEGGDGKGGRGRGGGNWASWVNVGMHGGGREWMENVWMNRVPGKLISLEKLHPAKGEICPIPSKGRPSSPLCLSPVSQTHLGSNSDATVTWESDILFLSLSYLKNDNVCQ